MRGPREAYTSGRTRGEGDVKQCVRGRNGLRPSSVAWRYSSSRVTAKRSTNERGPQFKTVEDAAETFRADCREKSKMMADARHMDEAETKSRGRHTYVAFDVVARRPISFREAFDGPVRALPYDQKPQQRQYQRRKGWCEIGTRAMLKTKLTAKK